MLTHCTADFDWCWREEIINGHRVHRSPLYAALTPVEVQVVHVGGETEVWVGQEPLNADEATQVRDAIARALRAAYGRHAVREWVDRLGAWWNRHVTERAERTAVRLSDALERWANR